METFCNLLVVVTDENRLVINHYRPEVSPSVDEYIGATIFDIPLDKDVSILNNDDGSVTVKRSGESITLYLSAYYYDNVTPEVMNDIEDVYDFLVTKRSLSYAP